MSMWYLRRFHGEARTRRLVGRFFETTRRSLVRNGTAWSKHYGGTVPDNPIHSTRDEGQLRQSRVKRGRIHVEKDLTPDFTLVVKHPSAFSAVLHHLRGPFRCFAVVRNPLSVLGSWNSVNLDVNRGHAPAAERLDKRLRAHIGGISDRLDRQVHLISWFFGRFADVLPRENIIRYEDIVSTSGKTLSRIDPAAGSLERKLTSKNKNRLYDESLMQSLAERLRAKEGAYLQFYTQEDIDAVLQAALDVSEPPPTV
jgi:hypothetical protein